MEASRFYDDIADVYHLVYADWERSIERHAHALDSIIRERLGAGTKTLLDASCGIGTQVLGLAKLGYVITASDISPNAIERARREAERRCLKIDFGVADMRRCDEVHRRQFDVVLSADNSVPHLLSHEDILTAFRTLFRCTAPGGLILVSVRDYDCEDHTAVQLRPYGVRYTSTGRTIVFQVWEFEPNGTVYEVAMYFVGESRSGGREVIVSKCRYFAVSLGTLCDLLQRAGYSTVERVDDRFFQPVLVGRRAG